jgi:hypothetical protein
LEFISYFVPNTFTNAACIFTFNSNSMVIELEISHFKEGLCFKQQITGQKNI